MVSLTINQAQVSVEPGVTILEAAAQEGVHIPTLCHDKRLQPYGGCGLCMVEVTIQRRKLTLPACATFVEDGMHVSTQTAEIEAGRRKQLMLLLRTHPVECPTCDAAGNCRLQELVHEYEISELPFPRKERDFHVDNKSHFIRFDMNVCVRCGLCVRICDHVQGEGQLSLVHRGIASEVTTSFNRPLNCELCGQCAQVCPVGAISSKWIVGKGRRFQLKKTNTVCSFCGLGCTLTLNHKNDQVVHVTSPLESSNEGNLCVKGRYGWSYVYSQDRLTRPLLRKAGVLQEAEWDEAISFVARGLLRIKERFSPTSLAALGSSRLTNEEAYAFNRFVRTVLGTPHLDHDGGRGYRALSDGPGAMLGYPASTGSIDRIKDANLIVLFGADLTESHPVAKNEVIMATGPGGCGRVVVIDSVRTKLCERRGTHLLTKPGTEHFIPFSMLREIIYKGLFDPQVVESFGTGFQDLIASLEQYGPEEVARFTGTDPEVIRRTAVEYAEARRACIILTAVADSTRDDAMLARAAINLAAVTGRLGKPSCGVYILGEKANSQGAVEMGLTPDRLPGFRSLLDERARGDFCRAWGSDLPREVGLDARNILKKANDGEIRGLYVVGENPVDTYPERPRVIKALSTTDFLVVHDMFLTPTCEMAHAVLPVLSFMEKSGTLTSAFRSVKLLRPLFRLPGPRSDLDIFQQLAAIMGKPDFAYESPEDVMNEISGLVEAYRHVSYERLGDFGIVLTDAGTTSEEKEVLHGDGCASNGVCLYPAPAIVESRDESYPFSLIPRSVKFHSGSMSRWSPTLMRVSPDAWASMNTNDMLAMNLSDGDTIRITSSEGGIIETKVKESSHALQGTILLPKNSPSLPFNEISTWEHAPLPVKVKKIISIQPPTG